MLDSQDESSNATYVVVGHVVCGRNDSKSLFVSENMGCDAQAKASWKAMGRDTDRALQHLLEEDRKVLVVAREFGEAKEESGKEKQKEKKGTNENVNVNARGARSGDKGGHEESDEGETETKKSAYSVEFIKQLGFDPVEEGC